LAFLGPVSLFAFAIFACEDESTPAQKFDLPETGVVDTNQPPVTPPDATALPDALPDVVPDAPKTGPVTVTITSPAGPRANITIVFHDAAGAILSTVTTGADGKATSTGATPAMVTALVGNQFDHHLVTWTGVEAGDALVLRDLDEQNPDVGGFAISSGNPDIVGIARYEYRSNQCTRGDTSPNNEPIALGLSRLCVRQNGPSTVLVQAFDEGSNVVATSFKKGVTPPNDGGVVPVTMGAWTLPNASTVFAANPPLNGELQVRLQEISDGFGYDKGFRFSTDASAAFQTTNGFADAHQGIALHIVPPSTRLVAKRGPVAANIALDYATMLPAITTTAVNGANARRPVLSWTAAGALTSTDGGIVRVRFNGPEDADYFWTFVVPPGAATGTVTGPALPAAADAWLPPVGAQEAYPRTPDVLFVEADAIPSYAVFRAQQGTFLNLGIETNGVLQSLVPPLAQDGNLRMTAYSAQQF